MVHVLRVGIHNGIVAGRVEFVLQYLGRIGQRVVDGTQDLRGAAEGIIGLDLLFKDGFLMFSGEELNLPLGEAGR